MKSNIYAEHHPINTNLEIVAVNIWSPSRITICNIYIPPDYQLNDADLANVVTQLPSPFILVGDFNAHSRTWGSQKTFGRGKIIDQYLASSNMVLLNTGESTHLCSATGTFSNIDLSFSDPRTATSTYWHVLESLYDSDHFPISISLDKSVPRVPTSLKRWRLNHADWDNFQNQIGREMSTLQISSDVNKSVKDFNEIILSAAEKFIGTSDIKIYSKCTPWWNDECAAAVKNCKHALNRYRRHRNQEDFIIFKQMRAIARRTLKQSKKDSWRAYISSLTKETPTAEVWRKIKFMTGRRTQTLIPALSDPDNKLILSDTEIANTLASNFSRKSSDSCYSERFLDYKQNYESRIPMTNPPQTNPTLNLPITQEELLSALATCKNSAPGPDRIPYIFIQKFPLAATNKLLELFNSIWLNQNFPSIWHEAVVIPVLKPGKPKDKPDSYRPISLTCTPCKLLEKIVNKRLLWFLENSKLINKFQTAFRPHCSTTDNLLQLHTEILNAFANKQQLIAVFLDIKGAFDTAWRAGILNTMHKWKISGNMLAFISNFLRQRTFRARVNGTLSDLQPLPNGVPQGSILSPTLFNIAINDIFSKITAPVQYSLYADDVILFCRGKNETTICDILQTALHHLEEWSLKTGFQFSAEKSKAIKFIKRHPSPMDSMLLLNNERLQFVRQHKYLGLIFDDRLSWKPHIEQLRADCIKRLNVLKTLTCFKWGAQEAAILKVYRAVIRSKLDYGSIIYSTARKNVLKRLNVVHNSALRIALGAFRSSPAECLYREAGELPLWLRRRQITLIYTARISACPSNIAYNIINRNYNHAIFQRFPRLTRPLPYTIKSLVPDTNLKATNIITAMKTPPWCLKLPACILRLTSFQKEKYPKEFLKQQFTQILAGIHFDHILYTDASKGSLGVGCAVVHNNAEYKYHLSPHCSVFSGELYAILQALKVIRQQNFQHSVICTDSLSSIMAINSLYSSNPIVNNLNSIFTTLSASNKTVTLLWVPSHIGINGNESADRAAKEATVLPTITNLQLHYDLKRIFKTTVRDLWQRHWSSQRTKLHKIEATIKTNNLPELPRRTGSILRRLRIGHTLLTHKYLMVHEHPPLCEDCNEPLTVEHIVIRCRKYQLQRLQFNIGEELMDALQLHQENISDLVRFLKSINVYHLL